MMRSIVGLTIALTLVGCARTPAIATPTLVLRNVTLIDGIHDQALPAHSVMIQSDRITAVFPTGSKVLPPNSTVRDFSGATLLPGLINGHVHLTPNKDRVSALQRMLNNGVTSVRDLGGHLPMLSSLSASETSLPTVVFSATMFGSGFMSDPRVERVSKPFAPGDAPWMRRIDAATDIAAAVAAAKNSGASGLKLYASLDAGQVSAISHAAHLEGLPVWSHAVLFPATTDAIVAAGVDQIVHSKGLISLVAAGVPDTFAKGVRQWTPGLDFASVDPGSAPFQNLFRSMVEGDVVLEPALIADGDVMMARRPLKPWQTAQREWACRATESAAAAGVSISAGTDFFGEPGLLLREMQRLTQCGLTPMMAIKAATSTNAKIIGVGTEVGSISAGKRADVLIVPGNPLSDLATLGQPLLVIKSGQIVVDRETAPKATRD